MEDAFGISEESQGDYRDDDAVVVQGDLAPGSAGDPMGFLSSLETDLAGYVGVHLGRIGHQAVAVGIRAGEERVDVFVRRPKLFDPERHTGPFVRYSFDLVAHEWEQSPPADFVDKIDSLWREVPGEHTEETA